MFNIADLLLAVIVSLIKDKNTVANMWFCASGADRINIGIRAAIISSSGRPNAISKRTNNQLFILHSADGSGRRGVESPTCTKPWTLCATLNRSTGTIL